MEAAGDRPKGLVMRHPTRWITALLAPVCGTLVGCVTLGRPLFSAYARVEAAKPGAEVLARHPTSAATGARAHAILLALQRYGRGYSGVLTSPFYGQPTAVLGTRKVDMGVQFQF